MSLNTINDMRNSNSLRQRIVAAASKAGVLIAEQWSADNMLPIVTSPGWEASWDYAVDNATRNVNPDTGYRDDVISDGDIAAAVQARIDAMLAVELPAPDGSEGWPSWMDPTKKPKSPAK